MGTAIGQAHTCLMAQYTDCLNPTISLSGYSHARLSTLY